LPIKLQNHDVYPITENMAYHITETTVYIKIQRPWCIPYYREHVIYQIIDNILTNELQKLY